MVLQLGMCLVVLTMNSYEVCCAGLAPFEVALMGPCCWCTVVVVRCDLEHLVVVAASCLNPCLAK